jgi:hypothetical protein
MGSRFPIKKPTRPARCRRACKENRTTLHPHLFMSLIAGSMHDSGGLGVCYKAWVIFFAFLSIGSDQRSAVSPKKAELQGPGTRDYAAAKRSLVRI